MRPQKIKTQWNLDLIIDTSSKKIFEKKREELKKQTHQFVKKWKNNDKYLKDSDVLKKALDDYNFWLKNYGTSGDEGYYLSLKTSLHQNDPDLRARFNKIEKLSKNLENEINFFTFRLSKIDKSTQSKFLKSNKLFEYKHFLERLFEQGKFLLTLPEEKIINLKTTTSYSNWVRMTSSLLAKEERKITTTNGKETKNFSEILGLINSRNKKIRDSAAKALNNIFSVHLNVAENEINSILQDKATNDTLHNYKRPDKARHINDDIETEVVDTLVKTVSKNFRLAQDYYKLKAKLLGVEKLEYHERNVEYGNIDEDISFEKTCNIIQKTLAKLDGDFESYFLKLIQEGHIDAFPKKGKRNGAFASYNLISQPFYILLNHTGQLNDVLTFAHETGHIINYEHAKKSQEAINFGTPISTTEVASTFFEDFVLEELKKEADEKTKLALSMMKLNSDISTIFRQIAFYNFEKELHTSFRERGYLSKEVIGKLFQKHMRSYMGNFVAQSTGSENWWVYVNHFRYFFYVYSYASGLLISKSLQASVKKDPEFINQVKKFLSAGLSASPKNIFSKLGIDITNAKFWEKGIREVEMLLKDTETLAKRLG